MFTQPSLAPAVSVIVAGSPVERRHCPALLFTANTCKGCLPSWNWVSLPHAREARLQLFQSSRILFPFLASPRRERVMRPAGDLGCLGASHQPGLQVALSAGSPGSVISRPADSFISPSAHVRSLSRRELVDRRRSSLLLSFSRMLDSVAL